MRHPLAEARAALGLEHQGIAARNWIRAADSYNVPLRRGPRKTTLPPLPGDRPKTAASLTWALKEIWTSPSLEQLFGAPLIAPDPERYAWEDAVRSIERRHAAREEWPWPASSPSLSPYKVRGGE